MAAAAMSLELHERGIHAVPAARYDKSFSEADSAAYRYHGPDDETPLTGLVSLLAGFGAVGGDRGKIVITPLGSRAVAPLADGLSGPADPVLPAAEMIAEVTRFGDEQQQYRAARKWLAGRRAARAAREILAAAENESPLRRIVAIDLVAKLDDEGPEPGRGLQPRAQRRHLTTRPAARAVPTVPGSTRESSPPAHG
jgi:hypothetical protein